MLAPITEIFCDIDDFCNTWFTAHSQHFLPHPKRMRHRKPDNFLMNLVSGLMPYMLRPRKPAIQMPKKLNKMALLMSS